MVTLAYFPHNRHGSKQYLILTTLYITVGLKGSERSISESLPSLIDSALSIFIYIPLKIVQIVLLVLKKHFCKLDQIQGWNLCQLEVLDCQEVPWPITATEMKYCIEDCEWPAKNIAYECSINLLTGRTHQVFLCHCHCTLPSLPFLCL